MKAFGKRRSKSQRIGVTGEDNFRIFAGRHRLIANKIDQDFGTDFICQVEGSQDSAGAAPVLGGLVGAFVRATENRRGRIKLNRGDAEHLLGCEYPIFILSVHLHKNREPQFYFRFLDGEFAEILAKFLQTPEKTFSLTPSELNRERIFEEELSRALKPGFIEQSRLWLANRGLQRAIPKSRVQVRRSELGSYTLVAVPDFFQQFEDDSTSRNNLYNAVFGSKNLMLHRLGEIPIRPEVITSLKRLPSPAVIAGPMIVHSTLIKVIPKRGAIKSCMFAGRKSPGFTGWVHKSGFALTVSDSTLHEGKWVHWFHAKTDPDLPITLSSCKDLWTFLDGCKPEAKIQLFKSYKVSVEIFENLLKYGFFAQYLKDVEKIYAWPERTWFLNDAENEETLNTLGFLSFLYKKPDHMKGFGFIFGEQPLEEKPIRCWIPISMNLPRAGLIVWILTEGLSLMSRGVNIGLKISEILEMDIEIRGSRFIKSPWPEVVIHPDNKSVPLAPTEGEINRYRSDPSTWNCGIFIIDDEDE